MNYSKEEIVKIIYEKQMRVLNNQLNDYFETFNLQKELSDFFTQNSISINQSNQHLIINDTSKLSVSARLLLKNNNFKQIDNIFIKM